MKIASPRAAFGIALNAAIAGGPQAQDFGPWGNPQPVAALASPQAETCPIESADGLALYFASDRAAADAQGKLDIWRAARASTSSAWTTIEDLGPVANSPEFDDCPTPLAGNALLFVSSRQMADDCAPGDTPPASIDGISAGDIFAITEDASRAWSTPVNLGCYPDGPNTAGAELGASVVATSAGKFLFFSSDGYPDSRGQDIYMSAVLDDGTVQAGMRVAELSSAADDRMPNVRADGLEIVFSSDRGGDTDIYVAAREDASSPWSAPQRLEDRGIDTSGSETCPSLSADGTRLYFARRVDGNDPGDIFVATRARLPRAQLPSTPTLSVSALVALALLVIASAGFAVLRRSRAEMRRRRGLARHACKAAEAPGLETPSVTIPVEKRS
jgi:hypothetical protein